MIGVPTRETFEAIRRSDRRMKRRPPSEASQGPRYPSIRPSQKTAPMTIPRRIILLVLSLVAAGANAVAAEPRPLIVAHRGLLRHAPENTLANFRACLELRLGFEFDVQATKDGQLVCIHDGTVDRTTTGRAGSPT